MAKNRGDRLMLRSDEELEQVRIGPMQLHNAQITLSEYDPNWPLLFQQEARRLRQALSHKALMVEHVGSTSVPGLCAKPIIDMLLVVEDSADEPAYALELEAAGYSLKIREPDWFEHRLLKGPETDINLHVFSAGASEIEKMLRFRNLLRTSDADRDEYAEVKRSLAKRTWRHVQHYADAKTAIIERIIEGANASG